MSKQKPESKSFLSVNIIFGGVSIAKVCSVSISNELSVVVVFDNVLCSIFSVGRPWRFRILWGSGREEGMEVRIAHFAIEKAATYHKITTTYNTSK